MCEVHMRDMGKTQAWTSKVETTVSKMKSTLDGVPGTSGVSEGKINQPQRDKKTEQDQQSISKLWENFKRHGVHVMINAPKSMEERRSGYKKKGGGRNSCQQFYKFDEKYESTDERKSHQGTSLANA